MTGALWWTTNKSNSSMLSSYPYPILPMTKLKLLKSANFIILLMSNNDVFIADFWLHLNVYCRRQSFSSCCCSYLEQSIRTRNLCTSSGSLLVPSKNSSVLHLLSHSLVCNYVTYLLTYLPDIINIRWRTYALAIIVILLIFSSIGFSSCSRFCCLRWSTLTDARSLPTSSRLIPFVFSLIQSFSSSHIFWNSSILATTTTTTTTW